MSNNLRSKELNQLQHPIDFEKLEHRPCVCGGRIYRFELATDDKWICNNCCGAAGDTYEEAVREKIKVDLMRVQEKAANFLEGIHNSM
jgi:hypothetical protein